MPLCHLGGKYFCKQYPLASENLRVSISFVRGMREEPAKDISEAEGAQCRPEVTPGCIS